MILYRTVWLAIIIPSIAVQVRRLHDTDRSGWWLGGFYLYALYRPAFGSMAFSMASAAAVLDRRAEPRNRIWASFGITMIRWRSAVHLRIVLLVFFCLPGTPGPNKYGPDPYGGHDNLEGVFS